MSRVVPMLMYHIIAPLDPRTLVPLQYVHPKLLDGHMGVLKALRFQSVKMKDIFRDKMPKRSIVLTFDDAYENFLTAAVPTMKKYGFTSTVFVVGHQIGGTNAWDVAVGDVSQPLMNLDQIKESLAEDMEVGSHTLDHVKLSYRETDVAWRQIAESKEMLEGLLGTPMESFCYPYGKVNKEVRDMVEKAGYRAACTTVTGVNSESSDMFLLRRFNCKRNTTVPIFAARLWRTVLAGRA